MWKIFWCSAAAIGSLVLFVAWTGATSTFRYKHPTNKDVRIVIDRQTGGAVVEAVAFPEKAAPAPRAFVPQREHDFGRMDPHSSGKHAFEIKNSGNAPLELKLGETSCKCTLSGLDKNSLAPGEVARVTLEWNTGRTPLPEFAQSATVLTNDSLNKRIELIVQGKVKTDAGLDVEEIALPALAPDAEGAFDFLVYSQMWDEISVHEVTGNLPKLEWDAEPIAVGDVPALAALAVQRVRVRFARPVELGQFMEELRIRVVPAAEEARAIDLYLPVRGSAIRRLAIYSPDIDESGLIDLGINPQGKARSATLLLKIRDPEPSIQQAKVDVSPDFLQAKLVPPADGESAGLYRLVVELPADAPTGQFRSNPLGYIRLDTGHPRIGVVELKVSFAVMPRERL
jgi:hypothetical protein